MVVGGRGRLTAAALCWNVPVRSPALPHLRVLACVPLSCLRVLVCVPPAAYPLPRPCAPTCHNRAFDGNGLAIV